MNLDGLLIGKYTIELNKILPAKINKISQISDNEFLFQIRSKGKNEQLFISVQSKSYRFHISNLKYNTSFEPSSFLMILRKYLTQSILFGIEQLNGDRVVCLKFQALNNLKDKVTYYLYLEFFGKYTNIILVNQDNKIIDCLKKTSLTNNRILFPQAAYTQSFNHEKKNLFKDQSSKLEEYNGISKLIADLNLSSKEIYSKLMNSNKIYYYPSLEKFHLIPFSDTQCLEYDLFEAMDKIYFQDENRKRINEISGNISHFVKKELEKSNKKLVKLNSSLKEAQDLDKYKRCADLLYAYHFQLKDYIKVAELTDFDGNNIKIELDSKYTIKENAKRYYKKYTKAKTALHMIAEQIEKTKKSIHYFNEISDQLEFIQLEDALEIAEELNLNSKKQIKSNRKKQPNFLILEIDNVIIYVGKNNIQNDYITNKISKKHYLWFHVKDFHGSHVVVNQSEVSEEILRLCASLAAYYSKARYSSSIPVNYCLLKQLKATRGNALGMVFLGNYKTIYIDINEKELIETIEKFKTN